MIPEPRLAPNWSMDIIVPGSSFHTANGIAFGPDGRLFVASVVGEAIFALDLETKAVEVVEPGPVGEADDLVFTPGGDMIWTALLEGKVRMRRSDGTLVDLAEGLPGANSIALTRDGTRLFMGQVFMGEGLWEIDLAGAAPPRLVTDDTGGLNAFQFGTDGMIYAPSWERGHLVRVDPETGKTEVLIDGLQHPGAVRFDAEERLYVLDDATGEFFAVAESAGTWTRRLIAKLATSTDNFMFGRDGRAYVSNMADNAIHAVDVTNGAIEPITVGALGLPRGIALSQDGALLHIADACAYRTLDLGSGVVRDIARAVASPLKFPAAVDAFGERVLLVGELFGVVQQFDGAGRHLGDLTGFDMPSAAIALEDGGIVVAEATAGRIVHVHDAGRRTLVDGLDRPVALARLSGDDVVVAETDGRLFSLNTTDGSCRELATVSGKIRAVAVAEDGGLIVLDVEHHRVVIVDPLSGNQTTVAEDLPVGHLLTPFPRSGGIVAAPGGTIYLAADLDNSILRLSRST
jgi:sugar lactone lactonase YvrE